MLFENFAGGSHPTPLTASSERTVNWFPRKVEAPGGKAPYVLESTPGYAALATAGTASGEHIVAVAGPVLTGGGTTDVSRPYVLTADSARVLRLYSLNYSGSYTAVPVANWTMPAFSTSYYALLWSGTQFLVIGEGYGYLYTPSTAAAATLGAGASAGFPAGAVTAAAVVDGYFLAATGFGLAGAGQNTFYQSGLYDGATWSALNVATARGAGDNIEALIPLHRELWVFGQSHAEVYYDAGSVAGTTFAWARNNNVYLEVGCPVPASLCRLADTLAWVGGDERGRGIVYLLNGYTPQRISTHAVERSLQSALHLHGVKAYALQREGHQFYVVNNVADGFTWVYDLTTGLWHEWLAWSGSAYSAHPLTGAFYATLDNVFGTVQLAWTGADNVLYAISSAYLADNGNPIKRTRRAAHLVNEQKRVVYSQFALDCNAGVQADGAAQSGTVSLNLSWSDDGGNTFTTPQSVSLPAGNYKTRAVWRRLGHARDRVFEVSTTSNYNVTLNNAFLELGAGTS
jgi:hypothetical protein